VACKGDAIIPAHRHRNTERDQFLYLRIKRLRDGGRSGNARERLENIRSPSAQVSEARAPTLLSAAANRSSFYPVPMGLISWGASHAATVLARLLLWLLLLLCLLPLLPSPTLPQPQRRGPAAIRRDCWLASSEL